MRWGEGSLSVQGNRFLRDMGTAAGGDSCGLCLEGGKVSNMERRPGGRKRDRLANETPRLVPECQSQVLDFIVERCAPG